MDVLEDEASHDFGLPVTRARWSVTPIMKISGFPKDFKIFQMHPSGKYVFTNSRRRKMLVLNLQGHCVSRGIKMHVRYAKWSRDGNILAVYQRLNARSGVGTYVFLDFNLRPFRMAEPPLVLNNCILDVSWAPTQHRCICNNASTAHGIEYYGVEFIDGIGYRTKLFLRLPTSLLLLNSSKKITWINDTYFFIVTTYSGFKRINIFKWSKKRSLEITIVNRMTLGSHYDIRRTYYCEEQNQILIKTGAGVVRIDLTPIDGPDPLRGVRLRYIHDKPYVYMDVTDVVRIYEIHYRRFIFPLYLNNAGITYWSTRKTLLFWKPLKECESIDEREYYDHCGDYDDTTGAGCYIYGHSTGKIIKIGCMPEKTAEHMAILETVTRERLPDDILRSVWEII